jgi:hypothetical protein
MDGGISDSALVDGNLLLGEYIGEVLVAKPSGCTSGDTDAEYVWPSSPMNSGDVGDRGAEGRVGGTGFLPPGTFRSWMHFSR